MTPQPDRIVEIGAAPPASREDQLASPPSKLLVTPEEAAAILSVGRSTIYELMASGQLESVHVKSSRRVPMAALEAFVQDLLEQTKERGYVREAGIGRGSATSAS